jgi:predicted regulator of Ras-like GTPase activity (Roadblock/LC7/MglB family)
MTTTWSLPETDSRNVDSVLEDLLKRSQALAAHLVDRSGQLIASVGEFGYDLESFASLAAADLSANDELARLIGEPHVDGVACIGSLRSMASTQVGENLVLCVVFDRHSTLGLVRHRMRRSSEKLWVMFAHFNDSSKGQPNGDKAALHFGVEAANALDDLLMEDTV